MKNYYITSTSGSTGGSKRFVYHKDDYAVPMDGFYNLTGIERHKKIYFSSSAKSRFAYNRCVTLYCEKNNVELIGNTDSKKFLNELNNDEENKFLVTSPSFLINLKDHIDFSKIGLVLSGGEALNETIANHMINHKVNVYELFATTETFFLGIKKYGEEYYKVLDYVEFIVNDKGIFAKTKTAYYENKVKTTDMLKRMGDSLILSKDGFKFLSRDDDIVKVNEVRMSLTEVSNTIMSFDKEFNEVYSFKFKDNDELDKIGCLVCTLKPVDKNEILDRLVQKYPDIRFDRDKIKIESCNEIPTISFGKKDLQKIKEYVINA